MSVIENKLEKNRQLSEKLMTRATHASVIAGSLLAVIKFIAYIFTGSVAMLSSLVDSLLDVVASTINLFAVRHALIPADKEHRFGHGKAESLAGIAQSAFITGSALFLCFEAVNRLINPSAITHGILGIIVMVISIIVTAGLVLYQRYVIRKTGSLAISADSLHYFTDLLVNLCVIIAIVLSYYLGWVLADPIIALGIAMYIMYSAWGIASQCLDQLMDKELPDADREKIRQIAKSHTEVRDIHELRSRSSGRDIFIQLHLEMDRNLSLESAHQIAVDVEQKICEAFPNADVLIHEDPEKDEK
jgi:ferrous-iron efflux pump FieF